MYPSIKARPELEASTTAVAGGRPGRLGRWHDRFGLLAVVSAGLLAVLVSIAILGPLLAPKDPNLVDLSAAWRGPSADAPLGTDSQGRDLLSRLLVGARTSLLGPLIVVGLATVVGIVLALIVVWRGGWAEAGVSRTLDVVFAFPGLLLAILVVAVFGKGLLAAALALSVSYTPYVYRLVRASVIRETARPYIVALRSQGLGGIRIARRHLLPNIASLLIAQSTVLFAYAIADLAAISFLGLGVQPPTADWGGMVASGLPDLQRQEFAESLSAAVMIAITIVAANLLGSRLGDRDQLLRGQ